MKRKIGVIICMLLLLSMTFTVTTGQKVKKDNNESINFLDNSPPSNPILTAPNSAKINRMFVVKAVSNDPEDDQIYYRFKIGEDSPPRSWRGPFKSEYQFKLNVKLIGYSGDLVIGFQAKDVKNAESNWTYHTTTYTKEKSRTFAFNHLHLLSLFLRLSQIFKQ